MTEGPEAVKKHQVDFKQKWEARAAALKKDQEDLCAQLHPDVAPFARRKVPLLLKEMLTDLQFPAADLTYQFVTNGVPMFGPMQRQVCFHLATIPPR